MSDKKEVPEDIKGFKDWVDFIFSNTCMPKQLVCACIGITEEELSALDDPTKVTPEIIVKFSNYTQASPYALLEMHQHDFKMALEEAIHQPQEKGNDSNLHNCPRDLI